MLNFPEITLMFSGHEYCLLISIDVVCQTCKILSNKYAFLYKMKSAHFSYCYMKG